MKRRHGTEVAAALALVWALSAIGCAPGENPPTLAAAVADGTGDDGLAQPYEVDESWWEAYGDERLNALVGRAFDNNLDLAQSALSVRQALNQAYLAGVDLRPRFSAGLGGSWSKNIKDGGPTSQNYAADFGVSYEVDLWRRLRDIRDARVWEVHATAQDAAATRLALAHGVVDAYYHLAYILDATAAILESMDHYEEIERVTKAKHSEGKVAAVEPTQARQSWLSANATFIDLQNQRKTVEQTLRNLLNLRPGDELEVIPPTLADFEPPPLDLDVPLAVLSNRPDLRAAEHRLCRSFTDLSATRKSWYPTVTLGGSLSSSARRIGRTFDVPFTGGNVSVDFPFLQWNTVRGNVRVSETEYEKARVDFEQKVVSALNEVDTYRYGYLKALETLDNGRAKLEGDIRIGEHYRARYEEGANELLDWLNALNTVTNSRLSTIQNRYQVLQYENLVYQALAGRHRPAAPETTPAFHAAL